MKTPLHPHVHTLPSPVTRVTVSPRGPPLCLCAPSSPLPEPLEDLTTTLVHSPLNLQLFPDHSQNPKVRHGASYPDWTAFLTHSPTLCFPLQVTSLGLFCLPVLPLPPLLWKPSGHCSAETARQVLQDQGLVPRGLGLLSGVIWSEAVDLEVLSLLGLLVLKSCLTDSSSRSFSPFQPVNVDVPFILRNFSSRPMTLNATHSQPTHGLLSVAWTAPPSCGLESHHLVSTST